MNSSNQVSATPGMFRNALAPAAAICLGLGALLGLGSVLYLAVPGYLATVTEKILISGVRSDSAMTLWTIVHMIISVICCICPALTVCGMILAFRGQAAKGMNLLSSAAHWLLILLRILGWALLGAFILYFIRNLFSIAGQQDWPYLLFAALIMDAMVMAIAVFSYRLLYRFLYDAEGCTASIGYTLASGKLDPGSIPAFVASGLTMLGVVGLVLTADRLITMTIGYDGIRQFYTFVWSKHPGQWLCAGSLFFGAVGDFLLSAYLRFFKRTSERAVFYATYGK